MKLKNGMKNNLFYNWPLVTVYIVTKNHEKFVNKCIKSILAQTYNQLEIFIIDDNSSDRTEKKIKEIIKNKKKIKFLKNKKTLGLQRIANKILYDSKGQYIIRVDGDDWLDENALLNLITKTLSKKNVGAVYGGYYYVNGKDEILGEEKNVNKNISLLPPHGACTLFNSRALKQIGGYSEDIKSQDGWEVWYKIREKYNIFSISNSIFYYRQHSQSLTRGKNILKDRDKIVKKISKAKVGDYNFSTICILPIKNNYNHQKNVSFLKYKKKNLIDINVQLILSSKSINKLVVSSSDVSIKNYLKKKYKKQFNKFIFFIYRPIKYDSSVSAYQDLIKYTYDKFCKKNNVSCDIIFVKNFHHYSNDKNQFDRIKQELILGKHDIVFSVYKQRNPTFILKNNKLKILNSGRFSDLEYNNEKIYNFDETIFALWSEIILKRNFLNSEAGFVEANSKVINLLKK